MEPFNEAKYRALMDGLECSEVMLSNLEFSGRIDAEYYQKSYLQYEKTITEISSCQLSDIASFLIGPFGSAYDTSRYVDYSKYRYVRGQDVKPYLLQDSSPRYMLEADFLQLEKYALKPQDILVSVVGTLGNAAIVQEADTPAIFSCKSTAIRGNQINPYYLMVYLNTTYGRKLSLRKERGAIQKGLNLDDLKSLYVPLFENNVTNAVEKMVCEAFLMLDNSKGVYNSAQSLLLSTLNYSPIEQAESHTEKSFSTSFGTTGRLDAEYYQPKYDELCASLHTSDTVHSLCVLHDQNFIPNDKQKYTYIELADVGQMGEISGADPVFGAELPTRARRKVETGQVIISSIEGSLQSCALITNEFKGALCSTGFYILTSESLNPETLLVLFKSGPIQALMKQRCSGTILTAISKDELLSMPLPKIDDEVQGVIAEKVQESFSLRRRSKQLLESAKHAVEMAIEQGEDQAMRWLQEQNEI